MSFASTLKDELAHNRVEYEKDELSALFITGGNITISNQRWILSFKSENAKIAQKVYRQVLTLYHIKPITSVYRSMKLNKNNVYKLQIQDRVNEIIQDLSLFDHANLKAIVRSEHRIKSYLAGCFQGSGSVNNPQSTNYHLEMSFSDENFAKDIIRLMAKINLEAKMIKRRNQYVVYMKRAQSVADFIAGIGGTNSYLEFEDQRISRDFYNNDNRLNNCEIANSVRTNLAANEQLKNIEWIEKKAGLQIMSEELIILAQLRKENPEDSLRELSLKYNEKMQKNYTKSGINHMFVKIKQLADSLKDK